MNTSTALEGYPKDLPDAPAESLGLFLKTLPLVLFIAFFFPNTRIEPFSESMLTWRWFILALSTGLILLRFFSTQDPLISSSPLRFRMTGLFTMTFLWCGVSIIESVNPPLAFAKWAVFLIFLFFCGAYSTMMENRRDILSTLYPFIYFFIFYIWATLASISFFPQPLRGHMGYINGFMVFAPALGHFLAAFGIPAILFMLPARQSWEWKIFFLLTLVLAFALTYKSGSRAGTFTASLIIVLALLRWKKGEDFSFLKGAVICGFLLVVLGMPSLEGYFWRFLFKYPDETDLLLSRADFWDATFNAFRERPFFGYGFGVQEQLIGMGLGFFTIGFREQGSTFLGLLEEVGIIGALPMFLLFSVMGYRCTASILRSQDPLEIFFSRVVLVGLGLAAFENYLVYLGNATSILVFWAFFMRERMLEFSPPDLLAGESREEGAEMEAASGNTDIVK
jgi:O-antigen ligase